MKSKISEIYQRTTLQIVPTCMSFFSKVHRKHTKECVKIFDGHSREKTSPRLTLKKPQTLTILCKMKMEKENFVTYF